MTDRKTLDGNYYQHRGPDGRPIQPSNGGGVSIGGPAGRDPFGHPLPAADRVQPQPGGSVGRGINPVPKDPSPRDR
jgi:hypothetical protein